MRSFKYVGSSDTGQVQQRIPSTVVPGAGVPPAMLAHMFDPAAGNNSALLYTEQVLVFAVFVGSVAALPAFIEFVTEMRKRKERIDLSLEDEMVSTIRPRVAGMDDLLASIADLIDRARNPAAYQDLKIGNEVLIIGPHQTGKKSLAQRIAQLAGMDRVVTVFNPRDSDALAKAKSLVRGYKRQKVMLLLPRIDLAYQEGNPEVLTNGRKTGCFPDLTTFRNILGPKSLATVADRFSDSSHYFRLTTRVTLGTTEFTLYSLLLRGNGGKITPLLRSFGTL